MANQNFLEGFFGIDTVKAMFDIQKIANSVYEASTPGEENSYRMHCYIRTARGSKGSFIPSLFVPKKGEQEKYFLKELEESTDSYLQSDQFEWSKTCIHSGTAFHYKGACFFGYQGVIYAVSGAGTHKNFLMAFSLAAYFNSIKSFNSDGAVLPASFDVELANNFLKFMYSKLDKDRFYWAQ